jgi:CheY-like chemotaxis protein
MILLIKIHTYARHTTAEILRSAGYQVQEAEDGTQAFWLLSKHRFDLVVTDVFMPVFDGLLVAARIRIAWPDMPIIFTGYMPPVGADAVLRQPLGFVLEPIDPAELLATVRRVFPDNGTVAEIPVQRAHSINQVDPRKERLQ